jgi:formate dehydrogenase alpha subunit
MTAKKTAIEFTIDGQTVRTTAGKTVLQAALSASVHIPHLCYMPGVEPHAACRLCVVKVEGMRGLPAACTMLAADGMVVENDTDELNAIRRHTAELLIADHPTDCLTCSSNQQCMLQKITAELGITETRMRREERPPEIDDSNPFYSMDHSKCVLCGRCVSACNKIRGVGAIDFAHRGLDTKIRPAGGLIMDSTCESCGECIGACPVGALSTKKEIMPPTRTVKTTCPYCGCGCGLLLGMRRNRIVRVTGDPSHPSSHGRLCVKGRFGLDFVSAPDRLTTPLIRRNGELEEATWDEALELVASKLGEIKSEHGPDAIAGLSSAKCTNEENFIFQKFIRAGIGTNNVDHCARLCHASTVAGLARAFGSGAMTNSMDELADADCILVIGSNTTEAHPIIGLQIKAAVREHGCNLIVADPRRIDLVRFAKLHMRQRPGTDVMLVNAMMNVIVAEGLEDKKFIASRTEGFADAWPEIETCTPEAAAMVTGVAADDIREAARTFATAERGTIVYSMGITQHTTGTDNVLALANLAMLTGNMGRASTGVNPLRGQNNVQGACDLAALPNVLPGYQKVDDDKLRGKFEKNWGVTLDSRPGLTVVEMIHAAEEGTVRGMYIMGENPAMSDPNSNRTRAALENLEFLVVQDIFQTETTALADVVLPSACFAEKEGTFTNTERRVLRVRKAADAPGEARQDWQILCDVAGRIGLPMTYDGPAEIMDEIAQLSPIYGGMSYDRLNKTALQWPCRDADHPGTPYLHEGKFTRGLGKFHPTPFREPAEAPDRKYPLTLSTGRLLYHFHTGTLSRRTDGLEQICPGGAIEMNPADAASMGIKDGKGVRVTSRRGEIEAHAFVTERVPPGVVFMPFHFRESPANVLTNDALDPIAKIPELKVCAVKIKPVSQPAKKPSARKTRRKKTTA